MQEEVYEKSIFDEEQKVVVYAGFWERFGALFLDGLVLMPFSLLNNYFRGEWFGTAIIVMTGLIALIYKPIMEYLYGATLGKKALSIVVTNSAYEKPNLQEAILRNIFGIASSLVGLAVSVFLLANMPVNGASAVPGYSVLQGMLGYSLYVSSIYFFVYLADFIVFLADKQNRSLHDFIGKTLVIKSQGFL